MRFIWNIILLMSCGEKENIDSGIDTSTPEIIDADEDGFGELWDCDDNDPNRFPGNPELCDGIDNNCDENIDEDITIPYFIDNDGDGFGDESSYQESCEPVDGHVDNSDDCDDGNADINPDADEICDDVDNNCDGSTTDGASDISTWYIDSDEDGYGSEEEFLVQCDRPDGYVDTMTDCNDSDDTVYPEAPEICDNADNDCDEEVDEDVSYHTMFYQDQDEDGYGNPDVSEESCFAPENFVTDNTDCNDVPEEGSFIYPDNSEICNGIDDNCDGSGENGEHQIDEGVLHTYYEDSDGDGYGNSDVTVDGCIGETPENHVEIGDDCDDSNEHAWSDSSSEICDGFDNNCDGSGENGEHQVDEDVTIELYPDIDEDTFGSDNEEDMIMGCEDNIPEGYVSGFNTDCNDNDPDINPGEFEIPGDGKDNDCNEATSDEEN